MTKYVNGATILNSMNNKTVELLEKRTARINFYMRPSTLSVVKYFAAFRGISVSTAIQLILDEYLKDIKITGSPTASEVRIPEKYRK